MKFWVSPINDKRRFTLNPSLKLPVNLSVEQAILGTLLTYNEAFYEIEDILCAHHFTEGVHIKFFETISDCIRKGHAVIPIMAQTYTPEYKIGDMTSHEYLAYLATNSSMPLSMARQMAQELCNLYLYRELMGLGQSIIVGATNLDPKHDAREYIQEIEKELYRIGEQPLKTMEILTFENAAELALEKALKSHQRGDGLRGLSSGYHSLDQKVGGFKPGDLIILAGRPGMGKTALATNIAYRSILKAQEKGEKKNVLFFSLEMTAEQLATRVIADVSNFSSQDIERGNFTYDQYKKIDQAAKAVKELSLQIDHSSGLSIAQVRMRARRFKRRTGLDLIIIDYLQLLSGTSKKSMEGRVSEITEITIGLKAMAKELEVPVIALSQLSRGVENREDKRPLLSDLRDSGSIEQDADIVLFVYREAYYLYKKMKGTGMNPMDFEEHMKDVERKAEVIVAKNRHGETGQINFGFEPKCTRFFDLD